MADYSITPASIATSGPCEKIVVKCAAAISQGEACYLNSNGRAALTDADAAATSARPYVALTTTTAAGQEIVLLKKGKITGGMGTSQGVPAFLSTTPGAFCPYADLAAEDYPVYAGMPDDDGALDFDPHASGAQIPEA
jgi:hypothetical protein